MFCVCHAFYSVFAALWSPAGKGLTSGLPCMWRFIVFLLLSHVMSWVRCGDTMSTLKIFSSETTRPRAFLFGMHNLVDLYQVPSNYAPLAENGPAPKVTYFTLAYIEKT